MNRRVRCTAILSAVLACALQATVGFAQSSTAATPAKSVAPAHRVAVAKLIVHDLRLNQAYYETVFGMREVKHYAVDGVYDESIMAFEGANEGGTRLALFEPKSEKPLPKAEAPVVFFYTPDLDTLIQRLEAAKLPLRRLPTAPSSAVRIVITRDPSGNAVEIASRAGKPWEVGGAKLIVSNRQQAENFFVDTFGAKPAQRFQTANYDEVIMNVGAGAWVALFQPLKEAPLPKSQFPVVAIYTSEFDAVLQRISRGGLGYREVKASAQHGPLIIAKDPAGNAVEIIKR